MAVVLGIDAAWTDRQPSGVALVSQTCGRWRCAALAPSYAAFVGLAEGSAFDWEAASLDAGTLDVKRILGAARELAGTNPDVVAVDMPISSLAITGPRAADRAISREFGAMGCAAHSPSRLRPGPLSEKLRVQFERDGFALATTPEPLKTNTLVEVYPHPALLKLLSKTYRVPCKISKLARYWPGDSREQRVSKLLAVWAEILRRLGGEFGEIPLSLPNPNRVLTLARLKRYEDALDALVCAWVGVRCLEGRARPYGDDTAAIWVPV